jgi:hypothetical protein
MSVAIRVEIFQKIPTYSNIEYNIL